MATTTWPRLIERLESCTRCADERLLHPAAKPLFCEFRGERSDLLFVLEAPNLKDTRNKGYLTYDDETDPTGRFFRELYIDVLDEPIEAAAVTNAVLCLPALSGTKYEVTRALTQNCSPNLRAQIEALDPLVVVTLGNKALAAAKRIEDHGHTKISTAVGLATPWMGRTLLPLYHPGMQVRNNARTGRSTVQQREDWRNLKELLAGHRARLCP